MRSSTSKVEALLKYKLNDDIGWWLNGILNITDVDRVIHERADTLGVELGRWTYSTRQAVAALNRDEARRGPGFLFVPCGFGDTRFGGVFLTLLMGGLPATGRRRR